MAKKKWIQKAIKKPGSFTAWAKRQGYSGATPAAIAAGKRSKNPTVRRRAQLAGTLRKMRRRRKRS